MLRAQFFEEMFWLKQSNRKENKRLKENLGFKEKTLFKYGKQTTKRSCLEWEIAIFSKDSEKLFCFFTYQHVRFYLQRSLIFGFSLKRKL